MKRKTDPMSIRAGVTMAFGDWWSVLLPGSLIRRLADFVGKERDDAFFAGQERAAKSVEGADMWPLAARYIRAGIPCVCPFPRDTCPSCGQPDCPACAHVGA